MTNPSATLRAWRAAHVVVDSLKANNAFEAAAAVAFWFFLSVLPLLVLMGFLVGMVARSKGVDALVSPILDVVPTGAEDVLRHELDRMASTSTVAPLGVIGFLWTASSGLHNLMDVLESTAKVLRRPWWLQRGIALGWVLLGLAAACLAAWVLVRADAAIHTSDPTAAPSASVAPSGAPTSSAPAPSPSALASRSADHASHGTAVQRGRGALKRRLHKALHTPGVELLATLVVLLVGMGLLAAFYRYSITHPPDVRRRVWPGTFTAIASWLVVSWGFGLYAVSAPSYAVYYGSLAAVAVMMIWLYLTSLALLVGATVNAYLEAPVPKE